MNLEAEGLVLYEASETVDNHRLGMLATALGTASGAETARLVPFFGPTIAGETAFVDALGLDLSRALLGGLTYNWTRPFEADETVKVRLVIERVFDKGHNRFGIVVAEFTDELGAEIQRQSATFIESLAS